jgi:hypothetical protein
MWARVQLRPQTHHPDQPAAHTAFQTHWARLVSNMVHRSPHLRVLGAHFHHPPLLRPYSPGGAARGSSHTGQFSCFGPRSSCFIAFVLDIPNGFWPLNRAVGRAPIYAKQCLAPSCTQYAVAGGWQLAAGSGSGSSSSSTGTSSPPRARAACRSSPCVHLNTGPSGPPPSGFRHQDHPRPKPEPTRIDMGHGSLRGPRAFVISQGRRAGDGLYTTCCCCRCPVTRALCPAGGWWWLLLLLLLLLPASYGRYFLPSSS